MPSLMTRPSMMGDQEVIALTSTHKISDVKMNKIHLLNGTDAFSQPKCLVSVLKKEGFLLSFLGVFGVFLTADPEEECKERALVKGISYESLY